MCNFKFKQQNVILNLLFPNRCLECNKIISTDELVCGICMDQILFTHHHFPQNNLLKERCSLLFPVENAFALILFSTLPDNSHLSLSLEQIILQCSHLKQIKNYF